MMNKWQYWLPRVLAVLLIGFISLFALDVVNQPQWWIALPIHLIPSFILIIITAVAWNKERVGGWLFIAFGIGLLLFTSGEAWILAVPAGIIGWLFLNRRNNWRKK